MRFEWDEKKRNINLNKHGIDFYEAYEISNNPLLIKPDSRFDYSEERYIGLGITHKCIITIAFTEPQEDTIRIISLRKATKAERKIYEKYIKNRLG